MKRAKLSKIIFSHLIVISIVDINIGVNVLTAALLVYVKNFECIGIHSRRIITIYLQNTNAAFSAFHTVV